MLFWHSLCFNVLLFHLKTCLYIILESQKPIGERGQLTKYKAVKKKERKKVHDKEETEISLDSLFSN